MDQLNHEEYKAFLSWLQGYPFSYTPGDYDLVVADYVSGKPYHELESE